MVSPTKLAHVVLNSEQIPEMRDWYRSVLDGRVVHENPAMAFLTYDDEHHRIALLNVGAATGSDTGPAASEESAAPAGPPRPGTPEDAVGVVAGAPTGLSHIAFTYDSLSSLLGNYERLSTLGVWPELAINHGPTTSLYYRDPDGNHIELQVDNFATVDEGLAFMESESFTSNPIGVQFDPDLLLKRLRSGEPESESLAPTW
jgi:catechol-2,3-dioxygenase